MKRHVSVSFVAASVADALAKLSAAEKAIGALEGFSAHPIHDVDAVLTRSATAAQTVQPDPAPEVAKSEGKSSPATTARSSRTAAPSPTEAPAAPAQSTAASTQKTAAASSASAGDAVDYATLSKAVLKLMSLDPAAPAAIAAGFGFDTFKPFKDPANVALLPKAHAAVLAKLAELEQV